MRVRTGLVVVGLVVLLTGVAVFALGFAAPGGTLSERWVSDTARDNRVNHHAVGVGPDGDVVVAPVAEVPHSDVAITDASCSLVRLHPENGSTAWRNGVPADDCFTHALTEPAVADVDGDGTLEVVAATTEDALVLFDAATGREEVRVPLASYGYGRPTVADVRPAPGAELVASDVSGAVVVASANGTIHWRRSLAAAFGGRASVYAAPIVADVDADGAPEVVVGTGAGTAVLSAGGRVEWAGERGATSVTTGQVDADPALEIATANGNLVRLLDGATRDPEWTLSLDENARLRTMADGDGDGAAELYLGLTNGTVLAVDAATGATAWKTTVGTGDTPVVSSPVLANVDGEGASEVVAVSRGGTVSVLDAASGAELAASERSVPIWTFPTPADLDDDGTEEVLVRVVALSYEA